MTTDVSVRFRRFVPRGGIAAETLPSLAGGHRPPLQLHRVLVGSTDVGRDVRRLRDQTQALRLPLHVPAREPSLPDQFLDHAPSLMEATVVVSAHVSVVLRQPNVFDFRPASSLGAAFEAELGVNGRAVLTALFDCVAATKASEALALASTRIGPSVASDRKSDAVLVMGFWGGLTGSLTENKIVAYTDGLSTEPDKPPLVSRNTKG